jgi:hypothetical protein
VSPAAEKTLIGHIAALPLQPFQFGRYEGKRRVASLGFPDCTKIQELSVLLKRSSNFLATRVVFNSCVLWDFKPTDCGLSIPLKKIDGNLENKAGERHGTIHSNCPLLLSEPYVA